VCGEHATKLVRSIFHANEPPLQGIDRLNFERTSVSPYVTAFGWRTLCNAGWSLAAWLAVVATVRADRIPVVIGVILAAVALQAFYMPVHEAVHRTISARRPARTWLDRVVGTFSAFMIHISFAEHRHVHLLHHTHTNDEGDPDVLNAKGTPRDLATRVVLEAVLFPVMPILAVAPWRHDAHTDGAARASRRSRRVPFA
jgi:fatty acid desaturase